MKVLLVGLGRWGEKHLRVLGELGVEPWVADVAAVFRRLNPHLRVTPLALPEVDQRDYRVSTRRMREVGFRTRTDVGTGAEEMTDAIVSGLIPDPESIYYRNAKWLKELTQIGSKNPREVVSLMETLAQMRPR